MIDEYWKLLNLVEDKVKYGYKSEHENPEFSSLPKSCRACSLYLIRNSIVYGKGSDSPKLLIIGSWPTNEDEEAGEPISGEVRVFLDKWIKAMKLSPMGDCYITNLLKCKTGWNIRGNSGRHNHIEEINSCFINLEDEINRLNPKVILTLGEDAAKKITDSEKELESLRGHIHLYRGIPVISTYHPEVALENYDALRAPVWDDLKLVISKLDG